MRTQDIHSTPGDPAGPGVFGDTDGPVEDPTPSRIGQYLLQGELGHGGMGVVFRALHERLKRSVALKVMPPERMNDARAVARFQQEMEVIARLDHPNVVRALDAGFLDGLHFLVMELVEGADLSRITKLKGALPVPDACEMVRQAALGLQHAHENGLVHRDIKPSNLLLDRSGVLKVVDLGIARLAERDSGDRTLTGKGEIIGTVEYMAPEQGNASGVVDIRSDLYSLGCTLYKLLTGVSPFGGPEYGSDQQRLVAHALSPVPPIAERRPDLPEGLEVVLSRLLSKEPAGRPSTPAEVASLLAPFAAGNDLPRLAASVQKAASHADVTMSPSGWWAKPEPTFVASTRPGGTNHPGRSSETDGDEARARRAGVPSRGELRGSSVDAPTQEVTFRLGTGRKSGIGTRGVPIGPGSGRLLSFVALLTVGFVLGAVWVTRPSLRSGSSPTPKPGVPFSLLQTRPTALLLPDTPGNSQWRYEEAERSLQVNGVEYAVFRLGDSRDARKYSFGVTIDQPRWTGDIGIVFGWHLSRSGDQDCYRYQTIQIMGSRDRPDIFSIERTVEAVMIPSDAVQGQALRSSFIPRPSPGGHRLSITVAGSKLESVRWDGEEITALIDPLADGHGLVDADYRGLFGVVNGSNASVFRDASYLLHEVTVPDPTR